MKEEIFSMDHVSTDDLELTNLDNMTMRIFKNEIVGLLPVDEQGRKKLLEIMQYNRPMHYGWVRMNGRLVNSYLKSDLSDNRVFVISSKNRLVQDLSVSDNVFVLRRGFRQKILDPNLLNQEAGRLLKKTGLKVRPDMPASRLNEFERVVVELIRAVMQRAELIVFDEIGAFLNIQDIQRLRNMMHDYTRQGISFFYIGNHHEELIHICDRIMIMKNGQIIKNLYGEEATDAQILQIAGTEGYPEMYIQLERMIPENQNREYCEQKEKAILEFSGVSGAFLENLSFSAWQGECVVLQERSVAALEDMVSILMGNKAGWSGAIVCDGKKMTGKKGIHLLDDSIAVIQEHPHRTMIFPHMTFLENLCIMTDRKIKNIFQQKRIRRSIRKEFSDIFGDAIDERDMDAVSKENKYALVYYRYYMLRPKVVFCVLPFSGADTFLRRRILALIQKLKERGITVIILTVGLADSCFVADRLLMLERGSILYEFKREDFKYLWKDLFRSQ